MMSDFLFCFIIWCINVCLMSRQEAWRRSDKLQIKQPGHIWSKWAIIKSIGDFLANVKNQETIIHVLPQASSIICSDAPYCEMLITDWFFGCIAQRRSGSPSTLFLQQTAAHVWLTKQSLTRPTCGASGSTLVDGLVSVHWSQWFTQPDDWGEKQRVCVLQLMDESTLNVCRQTSDQTLNSQANKLFAKDTLCQTQFCDYSTNTKTASETLVLLQNHFYHATTLLLPNYYYNNNYFHFYYYYFNS